MKLSFGIKLTPGLLYEVCRKIKNDKREFSGSEKKNEKSLSPCREKLSKLLN
jgi:hypothetical protein